MENSKRSFSINVLKNLDRLDPNVYGGMNGQGHPDEQRLNRALSGKHWTDFEGVSLALLIADDVPLMSEKAFLLLFPAFLTSSICVIETQRGDLWHFIESFESSLCRFIERHTGAFRARLLLFYNDDQLSELGQLWEGYCQSLRDVDMLSDEGFAFEVLMAITSTTR